LGTFGGVEVTVFTALFAKMMKRNVVVPASGAARGSSAPKEESRDKKSAAEKRAASATGAVEVQDGRPSRWGLDMRPIPEVVVYPQGGAGTSGGGKVRQGDTVAVMVRVPERKGLLDKAHAWWRKNVDKSDEVVEVFVNDTKVPVYATPKKGIYRSLVATCPNDEPGGRRVMVEVPGRPWLSKFEADVDVEKRKFAKQEIVLDAVKKELVKDGKHQITDTEDKAWDAFHELCSEKQLWRGAFKLPVEDYIITTEYGQQRSYNGKDAEGYFHRGVDYGCWTGEPVLAPAAGRVELVGSEDKGFSLAGNCVGVDHGHGVRTVMFHLDTTEVTPGQTVKTGDRLGTVGTSGCSTGSHLHWGLWVGDECVDPQPWLDGTGSSNSIFASGGSKRRAMAKKEAPAAKPTLEEELADWMM